MPDLQTIIEQAFEHRADINPRSVDTHVKEAVLEALNLLDSGERRVAEKGRAAIFPNSRQLLHEGWFHQLLRQG